MREPRPSSVKRTARVAPQIRDVLSRALVARAADARLKHVVVTDVRVSPDLRLATVYYVALDDSVARDDLAAALERSRGFLRREIADHVRTRYTPEVRFIYDEAVERGRRVDEILAGISAAAPETEDGPEDTSGSGEDDA